MSCTLATLAACFSLSNLYVDGGFLIEDREDARIAAFPEGIVANGQIVGWQIPVVDKARNPYGRFSLGYAIDLSSVTVGFEATHISSVRAGWDSGVNSLELHARWYPFRR